MLRVTVLAVGGLKEAYLRDACAEYLKRLGAFCKPAVVEIPEQRLPQNPSDAEIQKALEAEGAAMLARLPKGAAAVALCIEGEQLSSEQLAARLARAGGETSHVAFLIGGSHGLSETVKRACAARLSMSRMTFPHQLARVLLLEQLYRAFSIAAGGKYHK